MLESRWQDDGLVGNPVNKLSGLGYGELPAGIRVEPVIVTTNEGGTTRRVPPFQSLAKLPPDYSGPLFLREWLYGTIGGGG